MERTHADVHQTHLPTTIAGGCAGFLSRDEREPGLARERRSVITRECEKGGPELLADRETVKNMFGCVPDAPRDPRPPFASDECICARRRGEMCATPRVSGVTHRRMRLETSIARDGNRSPDAILEASGRPRSEGSRCALIYGSY